MTDNHLTKLVHVLLSKQMLPQIHTSIAPSRFRHGVLCPKCAYQNNMYFHRGIWKCSFCHYRSIEIFAEAMLDYRLLISHSITNKQLRTFLELVLTMQLLDCYGSFSFHIPVPIRIVFTIYQKIYWNI